MVVRLAGVFSLGGVGRRASVTFIRFRSRWARGYLFVLSLFFFFRVGYGMDSRSVMVIFELLDYIVNEVCMRSFFGTFL